MYKLFLVDDEIWVIRGLMKMIPWEELGFEVIYTTTDSISALEKIALLKPDAVITDIRMASLNGLELLEQSLHMGKERPEFVLISAYEEFEYAHKALKLGAFDYLIKPLKKAELVQVLEKLKAALDQKNGGKAGNWKNCSWNVTVSFVQKKSGRQSFWMENFKFFAAPEIIFI